MRLRFETDEGWGARATLGLIVLQADETIEPELRAYTARNGVVLYHSRIPSGLDVTPESLAQMEAEGTPVPSNTFISLVHVNTQVQPASRRKNASHFSMARAISRDLPRAAAERALARRVRRRRSTRARRP